MDWFKPNLPCIVSVNASFENSSSTSTWKNEGINCINENPWFLLIVPISFIIPPDISSISTNFPCLGSKNTYLGSLLCRLHGLTTFLHQTQNVYKDGLSMLNVYILLRYHSIITVRNVVAARQCFHKCLSFCPGRHPLRADSPLPADCYWNAFLLILIFPCAVKSSNKNLIFTFLCSSFPRLTQ